MSGAYHSWKVWHQYMLCCSTEKKECLLFISIGITNYNYWKLQVQADWNGKTTGIDVYSGSEKACCSIELFCSNYKHRLLQWHSEFSKQKKKILLRNLKTVLVYNAEQL